MPNATVRANAQTTPIVAPLSGEELARELLAIVNKLDKARRLVSAAVIVGNGVNVAEIDPMMAVLDVAEDEIDEAYERLELCRPEPR